MYSDVFKIDCLLLYQVVFESGSFLDRPNVLEGAILSQEVEKRSKAFHEDFEAKFRLSEKGFDTRQIAFAKAALSNMLGLLIVKIQTSDLLVLNIVTVIICRHLTGGIGYFYGASKVQSKYNKEPISYWSAPLFTAVPSRSFFPRGFLWDEGFHNLLIREWNEDLSMEIIGYWMDLMNTEG